MRCGTDASSWAGAIPGQQGRGWEVRWGGHKARGAQEAESGLSPLCFRPGSCTWGSSHMGHLQAGCMEKPCLGTVHWRGREESSCLLSAASLRCGQLHGVLSPVSVLCHLDGSFCRKPTPCLGLGASSGTREGGRDQRLPAWLASLRQGPWPHGSVSKWQKPGRWAQVEIR